MKIQDVLFLIDAKALDESVQELIRDMKATQHGDRTNRLYDLLQDYHLEGGVWKHTKLAIDVLPEVAKALSDSTDDPVYQEVYDEYLHHLRAAALYHDIGKVATQEPSQKRPGSYSFPGHTEEDLVSELLAAYDIETNQLVQELVSHHHDTPAEVAALDWDDDQIAMLMILKAADNMAVGPRGVHSAITYVMKFIDAKGEEGPGKVDALDIGTWSTEDIEWAEGSELGFLEPEEEISPSGHVAGEIVGEPEEEEVPPLESSGEREVVVRVSTPPYSGFTKAMRLKALTSDIQSSVESFISQDVLTFLKNQTGAPEEEQWEEFEEKISLEPDLRKSFNVISTTDDAIEFDIVVKVLWG